MTFDEIYDERDKIYSKAIYEKLASQASEIAEEYKKNSKYWSNNKRKMHGLPMRRKKGKRSQLYYYYQEHKRQLFNLIEETIDAVLPQKITESYGTFADVRDLGENNG